MAEINKGRNRKPQTQFGVEVATFCAEVGMSKRELAEQSGVKYPTLLDCTIGRSVGHKLVPQVREFMEKYRKEA